MPDVKSDFISESTFTNWMLLSYKKQASASSALEGYPADQAFDENIKTYWAAQSGKDEWLSADLGIKCRINAIQVNFAEHETNLFDRQPDIYYQYIIEYSNDSNKWKTLVNKSSNKTDCPHDYVQLDAPVKARYIKLKILHIPDGKVAVSGLRIFGDGLGKKPGEVGGFMFASWVLHMSMLIFFSYIIGVIMKEWKGVNSKTYVALIVALLVLIGSFVLMSYGSYIGEQANSLGNIK